MRNLNATRLTDAGPPLDVQVQLRVDGRDVVMRLFWVAPVSNKVITESFSVPLNDFLEFALAEGLSTGHLQAAGDPEQTAAEIREILEALQASILARAEQAPDLPGDAPKGTFEEVSPEIPLQRTREAG